MHGSTAPPLVKHSKLAGFQVNLYTPDLVGCLPNHSRKLFLGIRKEPEVVGPDQASADIVPRVVDEAIGLHGEAKASIPPGFMEVGEMEPARAFQS